MNKMILPDWVLRDENYEPKEDRDDFISRSLLRIMGALSTLHAQGVRNPPQYVSAVFSMGLSLLVVILTAASHGGAFLLSVLALELVVMCFQDGKTILILLRRGFFAAGFSFILILPAFLLGSGLTVLLIPAKTFLSVTAMSLLTLFFPWHRLTAALSFFKTPAIAIFILDTALRYIFLLGRESKQLLDALSLRSVGKNTNKGRAMAGVLGATFLRSGEMSKEMYQAMRCRCFTGEYPETSRRELRLGDIVPFFLSVLYIALFIMLEG
ncbi:MAG: energy-coupling factor transporter transmembrane protein EcfT [Selenomonadaceae bacterium]|nr:energy-coupling factor transporter transmembrane protein EcfT [Selenomonadaceae bacterium]